MLHIKLKETEHRTPWKHIFCSYTHPKPLGVWSKGQNISFSESHVANKRELSIEHHASTYSVLTHTPGLWGWVKRSKHFFFLKVVMLQIKLNGAPCKHIFLTHTHSLWVGLKGKQNLNMVMLHIKFKGKKYRPTILHNLLSHNPGQVKTSEIVKLQRSLIIELSTKIVDRLYDTQGEFRDCFVINSLF